MNFLSFLRHKFERKRVKYRLLRDIRKQTHIRIILGAGGTVREGFVSTDYLELDICSRATFESILLPATVAVFVAEHVWEHLSKEAGFRAFCNCFEFLKPGGLLRVAVPDGFHPDADYIERVRPGGHGAGADDHKVLYDYRTLSALLESVGFKVKLLEWFDEQGTFHQEKWDIELGLIRRSTRFDTRNSTNPTAYTSLIIDAIKPPLSFSVAASGLEDSQEDASKSGGMISILQRSFQALFQKQTGVGMNNPSALAGYVDCSQFMPLDSLIRLGTPYGGWILPSNSDLTSSSICYLAGAGEDISFDCALARRFRCVVRIVDPTPRAVEHFRELKLAVKDQRRFPINNSEIDFYDIAYPDIERMSFLPFGLAVEDTQLRFYMPRNPAHVSCSTVNLQNTDTYFTAQCYRLSTLMKMQSDVQIDLLKIDIEGGEYAVIKDLLASNLLPRILLVEFDEAHTPLDNNAGNRIKESIMELVSAGMRCIAVEGCNATFIRTW